MSQNQFHQITKKKKSNFPKLQTNPNIQIKF